MIPLDYEIDYSHFEDFDGSEFEEYEEEYNANCEQELE